MLKAERLWRVSTIGWLLAGVFVVCATVGCGKGSPAALSGKVTYDGQPVAKGNIRLNPTGETLAQSAAAPIVDGSYEISKKTGLLAGEYRVTISAFRPATAAEIVRMKAEDDEFGQVGDDDDEGEEPDEEGGPQASSEPTVQYIPAEYNQATTLTVELTGGENSKDFDLPAGEAPGF